MGMAGENLCCRERTGGDMRQNRLPCEIQFLSCKTVKAGVQNRFLVESVLLQLFELHLSRMNSQ